MKLINRLLNIAGNKTKKAVPGEEVEAPSSVSHIKDKKEHQSNTQEDDSNLRKMERNFCDYFGATPSLPKIKKKSMAIRNEESRIETISEDTPMVMSESFKNEKLREFYARLKEIKKLKEESQAMIDALRNEKSVENQEKSTVKNSKSEGGLIFDFTKAPDANSFSLPAYFHKNMQVLQGILPLTIFNKAWQQAASDNHIDYRKQDKEVEKYRGHPYLGEWTQSRFKWNENIDSFINSCRETYKYVAFADALEIHKKNVITIFKQQRSWVVAFRYDLTIRKATFAIRNPGDSIPNPALEPPGLLNKIYYSARAQDDLNTEDNPYRKGGPKVGKNPYSDIMTESTASTSNYSAKLPQQPSYNSDPNRFKNQSTYGNYKGKRFNPNYKKPEPNKMEAKEKGKDKRA